MSLTQPGKSIKKNTKEVDKEAIKERCQSIDVINYMKVLHKAKSKKEAKVKLIEAQQSKIKQKKQKQKRIRKCMSFKQQGTNLNKTLLPIKEEAGET